MCIDTCQPLSALKAGYERMIRHRSDNARDEMDSRAKRLIAAREFAGIGSARAAALKFGWPESSYRSHENGTRGIGRDDAGRYAEAFGVRPDWLFHGRGPMRDESVARVLPSPNAILPGVPVAFPTRQIPVYGLAKAGLEGALILDGTVIDRIPALPGLEAVPDAYAVYVAGDSMEPRYFAGEAVYIHPTKPPRKGDFVVAQIIEDGGVTGYVKRLVGYDGDDLILAQFNPPQERRFAMVQVAKVELIVGTLAQR